MSAAAPDAAPAACDAGSEFTCALCGGRFTHGGEVCSCCPLRAGCDLVKCPSCGYQFPRSSPLVDGLRRWWRVLGRKP